MIKPPSIMSNKAAADSTKEGARLGHWDEACPSDGREGWEYMHCEHAAQAPAVGQASGGSTGYLVLRILGTIAWH